MDRRSFLCGTSAALAALPIIARPAAARVVPVSFLFHNGFYTNLHHRLYREAEVRREAPPGMRVITGSESLGPRDRVAWYHALAIYDNPQFRAGLTDPEMRRILEIMVASDEAHALQTAALPAPLHDALSAAAPIYRRTLWADDDAKNHAWIVSALPSIHTYGATVSKRLQGVWQANWPAATIRVDVVRYANALGSYTVTDPPHIIVASGNSLNAGRTALEVLFRELSFTVVAPDHGRLGTLMTNEADREHKKLPLELPYALVFFTAGRVVMEIYHEAHDLPYEPYANTAGMFERTRWQPLLEPLTTTWLPYMDGKGKLDPVVRKLVAQSIAALASAPSR